jgi:tetratricopeptide (TPR) repeat protein
MTFEQRQELIEKFFRNSLNDNEQDEFEELLKNDPDFKQELKEYLELYEGFEGLHLEDFKNKLKQWDKELDSSVVQNKSENLRQLFSNKYFLFSAASVIIIFLIVAYHFISCPFDVYDKLYEAPVAYLNEVRGAESTTNLLKKEATQSYIDGKYKKAVLKFSRFLKESPDDLESLYYLGISQMELESFHDAIATFDVIINKKELFAQSAEWFKLLSLHKINDKKSVIELAKKIANEKGHPQQEKALQYLEMTKN